MTGVQTCALPISGQSWIPSQYGVSPECLLVTPSLSVDSVVQGLADSAGACDLSLEVSLDLVGQNGLGQVRAKDGSIAQDAVQLIGAAVRSTDMETFFSLAIPSSSFTDMEASLICSSSYPFPPFLI